MIRKNSLFCKLIRIKKSSTQLFQDFMEAFSCGRESCPWCLSKGNCTFHASYERYLIDFISNSSVCSSIRITRLICSNCGHTHAILPDFIIPYSSYGLFFILRVLAEYFAHLSSVEKLCARFDITPSMLFRWKALFLTHKDIWMGLVASSSTSPAAFLRQLYSMAEYSVCFSCRFVLLTSRSFLQSHKNPALYRQTLF